MKLQSSWRLAILTAVLIAACTIAGIGVIFAWLDYEEYFRVCTQMGCVSEISVEFTGNIPPEYTVDVVGSDGTTLHLDCTFENNRRVVEGCRNGGIAISGIDFGPKELTITIQWKGGSATQTFTPDY